MKNFILISVALVALSSCGQEKTNLVFSNNTFSGLNSGGNNGSGGGDNSGGGSGGGNSGGGSTTPATPTAGSYSVTMQMVDRRFAADVLRKAFDIAETASTNENNWINNNVYRKDEFGGVCDPYAESDLNATTVEFQLESCGGEPKLLTATNNPMRFALTTKTCEYLTNSSTALTSFRNKVMGTTWKEPDNQSIDKAWSLFYPAHPLDSDTRTALSDIKKVASSNQDAWKLIAFTICSSPAWQVH